VRPVGRASTKRVVRAESASPLRSKPAPRTSRIRCPDASADAQREARFRPSMVIGVIRNWVRPTTVIS
jgi:hypothetical protein